MSKDIRGIEVDIRGVRIGSLVLTTENAVKNARIIVYFTNGKKIVIGGKIRVGEFYEN